MSKQEQIEEAWKVCRAIIAPALESYLAIHDSAQEAYEAKVKEINAQP